jgi:hypothetical protein
MSGIGGLRKDQIIQATQFISPIKVSNWRYGRECANVGGGLSLGTQLRIVETSTVPGAMWVRAQIPGSSPPRYLKIAGEEYAGNFRLVL